MIPLISSISFGPLGICHLPRFWWKVILREKGVLDDEYPDFSGGLDKSLLEMLNLDKDLVLGYLRSHTPSHLDFESWVLKQKGGSLDPAVVEEWNNTINNRIHGQAKLDDIHGTLGTPNDGSLTSAVILNQLEDWHFFQQRDLVDRLEAFKGKVVPLISTIDYGRTGIFQLPRTWLKVLLKAKGLLHPEYHDAQLGLDASVVRALKLDEDDMLDYLRSDMPSYVEFEDWVIQRMNPDAGAVEAYNETQWTREHRDERRAEIEGILGRKIDPGVRRSMILNRCEDWALAYNQIFA